LKYSAAEIKQVINSTDFKSFEDGWDPLRIPTKYGLYKGDAFLKWMHSIIVAKGLNTNATFLDFKNAGCHDLRVFATDLNIQNMKMFSVQTTPHVVVAEAVRASMSIPMFFEAWKFTNNNPDDHIYVDGGTVYNFPITTFDSEDVNSSNTLGLFLENLSGPSVVNHLKYDHLVDYVRILFETVLNAQVVDFDNDPFQESRTIRVDSLGMSAINFNLTNDQKTSLYNSGVACATKFVSQLTV
jgi:NTE family protein